MNHPPDPILVVDDDALALAIMSDLVRQAGYEPITARTAAEAQAAIERSPLLAFIDVHLPIEDGCRVCERIRGHERVWDTPVVMVTASESSEVLRRCFAVGADDFAPKPLSKSVVQAKIDAVRFGRKLALSPRTHLGDVSLATRRPAFGALITHLLEASGYGVWRAETLEAALADERRPHCAIFDLALGGDDPLTGLKAVLERAAPHQVPVIVVCDRAREVALEGDVRPLALFDIDEERERLVKFVNLVLVGSRLRFESRGMPRVPLNGVVRYRDQGASEWLAGYGYDLSETGIFVRTLTPLTARKVAELSFRLGDGPEQLFAKARVVWCNGFAARTVFSYPFGMGLQFTDFPAEQWARVHEHVQALLVADRRSNPPS